MSPARRETGFPWRSLLPLWGRLLGGDPLWLLVGVVLLGMTGAGLRTYGEDMLIALARDTGSLFLAMLMLLGVPILGVIWWLTTWITRWDADRRGLTGPWLPGALPWVMMQAMIVSGLLGTKAAGVVSGLGLRPLLSAAENTAGVAEMLATGAAVATLWSWRRLLLGHPPRWRRALLLALVGGIACAGIIRAGLAVDAWLRTLDQPPIWLLSIKRPDAWFVSGHLTVGEVALCLGVTLLCLSFLLVLVRLDGDPSVPLGERFRTRRRRPAQEARTFG